MNELTIRTESFEKIKSYLQTNNDKIIPVVKFRNPAELAEVIDFEVKNEGVSEQDFLGLLDKYLEYSVKPGTNNSSISYIQGSTFPLLSAKFFPYWQTPPCTRTKLHPWPPGLKPK